MQSMRRALGAILCLAVFLATGPDMSASSPGVNADASRPVDHELQGDARILHALNRLTFGPRPGDVDAVRAMGLERWFDQQLHPGQKLHLVRIDDSALEARLRAFPAMQRSPEDLLYRFPSNAIVRQVIDGKLPIPAQGVLHSVYENQVARVTAKRNEKDRNPADGTPTGLVPAPAMTPMQAAAATEAANPVANPIMDPAIVTAVLALPPQERVARLTQMSPPQFDAFLKATKGPQRAALTADLSPEQRETVLALENPERVVTEELMAQRLTRDIYSEAQLQEVMTDFWLNHFNVFLRKNEATPYYLVSYERDVIRPRALGKFEDLLEATAHSPAMLIYLDNAQSIGPDSPAAVRAQIAAARNPNKNGKPIEGLNENYARELMELHTLGVNGGYTQADVIQSARILTGWTVERPQRGGGFRFDENRHEPGTKKVLGKKFKEHGEQEGRELLHMLATRPSTAQFLSRKLAIRFVSDDPPSSLVDRMAKAYLSSGGDIAVVLKTMFKSPEFWTGNAYQAKVKTPLEYVISAARASNANVTNFQPLIAALRNMGMPLYGCIPPTGYKWDAADWVSTGALVNRMNFALSFAANRLNGVSVAWAQPNPGPEADGDATNWSPKIEEQRLERELIAAGLSESTRSAVLQQFEQQSGGSSGSVKPVSNGDAMTPPSPPPQGHERQDQLLAGLLLGSPEFQRR